MKKRYYLAYGSNLNIRQMLYRCPDAKPIGTAFIQNHILYFRGSKTGFYLTIEPKIGSKVPVAVWEISVADERALDRYEGFPTFYYKQDFILTVNPLDSKKPMTKKCFAYIMDEGHPVGIPSAYYLETCLDGYDDFGFDKRILRRTVERMRKILWKRFN